MRTRWISIASFILSLTWAGPVRAQSSTMEAPENPGREFVMSVSYGVVAGTLVGAASLAFTNKPGENLNRVARGASLGLYAGILLGLYVVYVVPGMDNSADEDPLVGLNRRIESFPLLVGPTMTNGAVDGVEAQLKILNF